MKSTPIDPDVARYLGQTEVAEEIRLGLEARQRGDEKSATASLKRAWDLATQGGHHALAEHLAKVAGLADSSGVTEVTRQHDGEVEDRDDASAPTMQSRPKQ